jgi:hypothetical protein
MSRKGARPASKPPALANPAAAAQLERAAAAAGLSVQELADLVFEAGVVPPPAKDGMTVRYTLAELGKKLWGTMQTVPRAERAIWFEQLAPVQRTAVIVVLRDQGFRTEVIARDLQIEPTEVMRTWNNYASQLGAQVIGIRLDTIAGQLQLASEKAQQMAAEQGDHRSYWNIEKQKVEMLQSIGIVERAIHRTEVTHKMDDQQMAEIEALAALRNKQSKRRIEIAEVVAIEQKGDAIPTEVVANYDGDDDDEDD